MNEEKLKEFWKNEMERRDDIEKYIIISKIEETLTDNGDIVWFCKRYNSEEKLASSYVFTNLIDLIDLLFIDFSHDANNYIENWKMIENKLYELDNKIA